MKTVESVDKVIHRPVDNFLHNLFWKKLSTEKFIKLWIT